MRRSLSFLCMRQIQKSWYERYDTWLIILFGSISFLFSRQTVDPLTSVRFGAGTAILLLAILLFAWRGSFLWPVTRPAKWFFALSLLGLIWKALSLTQAINVPEGLFALLRASWQLMLVWFVFQMMIREGWHRLGRALVLLSLCQSLAVIVQYYGWGLSQLPGSTDGFPFGFMAHRNLVGSFLLYLQPVVFWVWLTDQKRWKAIAALAMILTIIGLVLCQSRSPWLAAIIAVVAVFPGLSLLKKGKLRTNVRWLLITMPLLCLLLVGIVRQDTELSHNLKARVSSLWSPLAEHTDNPAQGSIQLRLHMWQQSWKMWQDHPLMGVGAGNWRLVAPSYHLPGFSLNDFGQHVSMRPHNDYLQVAAETGWPGFLIFVGSWGLLFWMCIQLWRSPQSSLMGRVLLAALVVMVVDMAFSFPAERMAHLSMQALYAGSILGLYGRYNRDDLQGGKVSFGWSIALVLILAFSLFLAREKYRFEGQLLQYQAWHAAGQYDRVIRALPPDDPRWVTYGPVDNSLPLYASMAYQATKQPQKALAAARLAEQIAPYSARLWNTYGTIYVDLQQFDQAVEALERALAIAPRYEVALKNIAIAYFNVGNYMACIRTIEKIDVANDDFMMGVYEEAWRRQKAVEQSQK